MEHGVALVFFNVLCISNSRTALQPYHFEQSFWINPILSDILAWAPSETIIITTCLSPIAGEAGSDVRLRVQRPHRQLPGGVGQVGRGAALRSDDHGRVPRPLPRPGEDYRDHFPNLITSQPGEPYRDHIPDLTISEIWCNV